MLQPKKLVTATLLGVIIAVLKGPVQPPYADFLVIAEAPIIALGFILLGSGGATYTELINGLLESTLKVSVFPFSLLLAVLYGVQVDFFSAIIHAKSSDIVSAPRMAASLTLSTTTTGLAAAYITISLGIVPYNPALFYAVYVPIVLWGILSGMLGGYISCRIWNKTLRARFKSGS
jgi:hypothetical protein